MKLRLTPYCYCAVSAAGIGIGYCQTITTTAGTPNCCVSTDGIQGTMYWLAALGQITIDAQGNLYFWSGQKILKLSPGGVVTTAVGSGNINASLNSGPAATINLGAAQAYSGIAADGAGNIYISDAANHAIRVWNLATGMVTTFAGTGTFGFSGDGGPATQAKLWYPRGVAVDRAGNVYVADSFNYRVRKVTVATGIITTIAGNGFASPTVTDEIPATSAGMQNPNELAVDNAGNVYISESNRIRKVDTSGIIHIVAGLESGDFGFTGDGGAATSAQLDGPLGMAFDSVGNLFFADNQNLRIRRIDTSGIITTYSGKNGNSSTPIGDGGLASNAYLGTPLGLVMDSSGDLILTGSPGPYYDVRKITPAAANGPVLTSAPSVLVFSFTAGGTTPAAQPLSVSSAGGSVSFTALATTSSGGNWLSVSPSSGTTPATINASVNPQGLSGGSYSGTVTITPVGGVALVVPVTLTVTTAGAPSISPGGIVNASGYQTTLAPDTVFTAFGSNLGPAALQSASAPDYPASLAGTSVSFTPSSGGTAIAARMIFTSASEVAGLLPSAISPGVYSVKVTYNSRTSAAQSVVVAARSFGIATANSAGSGEAQATIGNVNGGLSLVRLTTGSTNSSGYTWTLTPAHPGDTVVLWGTGGGADPANDTGGTSGDQTAAGNFVVTVDGTPITPLYAGASSGYPGLWQINFTLPATIAADCFASVQVSAGSQPGNVATLAIAAAGQTSCSSQISPSTLATLDSGGNVTMAGLTIGELVSYTGSGSQISESVGGVINQYAAYQFLLPYSGPKIGGCTVLQETLPAGGKEPSAPNAQLDAGVLKIAGPGVASQTVGVIRGPAGPIYNSTLAQGALQGGGTYTLTGGGGSQVGPFTATATFPVSLTSNLSTLSKVNHAQPLTITWTGSGFDIANILIIGLQAITGGQIETSVSCPVSASLGAFTIPAAAQAYLPAPGAWQVELTAQTYAGGVISAESGTSTALTPPLVGGGQVNFGAFTAYIVHIVSATVQ
jgi:uncharacterized protein (TIGR03437 family)